MNFDILVAIDLKPFLGSDDPDVCVAVRQFSDDLHQRLVAAFHASFPRIHESSINLEVEAYTHIVNHFEAIMDKNAQESSSLNLEGEPAVMIFL